MANAEKIKQIGFRIPEFYYEGQSSYGAGIYFYHDDKTGRILAIAWAKYKYGDTGNGACIIPLSFPYDNKRCLWWDEECEKLVEELATEYPLAEGINEIQLETKNELRKHIIEYMALRRGVKDLQVVFADFPVRVPEIAAFHPFQKGCCVMDISILPAPPYNLVAA